MTREYRLEMLEPALDELDKTQATSASPEELIEEFNRKGRLNVTVNGVEVKIRTYLTSHIEDGVKVVWISGCLFAGMETYYETIEEALIDVLAYNR